MNQPPPPKPPLCLTPQEERMLLALRQIREQARGRPWMVVVRGTDGLILVHEAAPPVKLNN